VPDVVSTAPVYGRPALESPRPPIAGELAARAGIALAIFLGALALGRVTAPAAAGGEAAPPAALGGSGSAGTLEEQLTGPPPLEHALDERAAAQAANLARIAAHERAARAARARASARSRTRSSGSTSTRTPRSESPAISAAPVQPVSAPAPARTPVETSRPAPAPAPREKSTSGSSESGGSFESSG
jgi:hypothetical protein